MYRLILMVLKLKHKMNKSISLLGDVHEFYYELILLEK